MNSSGVIVVGVFSSLLSDVGFTCSLITYDYLCMVLYHKTQRHRQGTAPANADPTASECI